ncbi:hypothetical protein FF38_04205 [Lucilia cuprina]|uniref:Uncharacterized protein n=1 Tax=Lucilia cuprina TaxID=7375 RepID=A0A0L0BLC0_LUCCU|nr:hypothetical protein FF38_04205 [Lucilia cuprina]
MDDSINNNSQMTGKMTVTGRNVWSRKCVKDCLGGENLHRFPKDPTRHLRILTADLGKFWSNSSISFRHLRILTADTGEIWSNSSVSFRYYLPFFQKEQLIWSSFCNFFYK